MTGSAFAFPPGKCTGTSCTGSATDSFAGVPVCTPGVTVYWQDSYISADVKNPRLFKFRVTPYPPCTGATVRGAVPDHFPASITDPDGKPAGKSEPGKAIFRFRWAVSVPVGSKPVGTMNVAWTLTWTKASAAGTTETETTTTTTTQSEKYDLALRISAPASISGTQWPQRIPIEATVTNNGPAPSPEIRISETNDRAVRFGLRSNTRDIERLIAGGAEFRKPWVDALSPCRESNSSGVWVACDVPPLAPHASKSFSFSLRWTIDDARVFAAFQKDHSEPFSLTIWGSVNWFCPNLQLETTCSNNVATAEIVAR